MRHRKASAERRPTEQHHRGAHVVVLLTDVTSAVALASRVFAAYYLLQAFIAGRLAWRAKKRGSVAFLTGIRVVMAATAILGVPALRN